MAVIARHSVRGFTLLEILVVLVLIGIMLMTIAPRLVGATGNSARAQAVRLSALIKAVRTQAILSADPCMIKPTAQGYTFLQMNRHGRFVAMTGHLFRARRLPPGVHLKGFGAKPLIFHASGVVQPFHWQVVAQHSRWLLSIRADGQMEVHGT